jgi:hypothetical protein
MCVDAPIAQRFNSPVGEGQMKAGPDSGAGETPARLSLPLILKINVQFPISPANNQ